MTKNQKRRQLLNETETAITTRQPKKSYLSKQSTGFQNHWLSLDMKHYIGALGDARSIQN
jgi:hypothetical protein